MAERVIWERSVDESLSRTRLRRFRNWFLIPAAAIVLLVLITAGAGNAGGAALVLAVVGGLWFAMIRFQGMSDRANPKLIVDSGVLRLGTVEVRLDDVTRYTTMVASIQTSIFGKYSRINLGKAVFRLDEPGSGSPDLVELGWPNMDAPGVAEIQVALERELPDRWVEPSALVDETELPKPGRPRLGPSSL